jgi:hypothetical protein
VKKDKLAEAVKEEMQAEPVTAGDSINTVEEFDGGWVPELSPELLKMDAASVDDTAGEAETKLPVNQVKQAEVLATEIAGFVAITVESITGKDYGLNPEAVKKWAAGVAPCLVKYGLTDMGEIMSKWGVEIQAGISTATLGFGAYAAHKKYQLEDLEEQKAKKQQAEKKEAA